MLEGAFLDFLDPWGNRIEVVEYRDIQYTKAPEVLRGMSLSRLEKSVDAKKQLAEKGIK
jgi:lactoylglutathione lyase